MKKCVVAVFLAVVSVVIPQYAHCQVFNDQLEGFHKVLENLYNEMIPMAKGLLTVAQAIAGFGALGYIGVRVWRHIAAAEAIDFFPLFRPFLISMLIGLYPYLLGLLNGILRPTIIATKEMVKNSQKSVDELLKERAKNIVNEDEWRDLVGGLEEGQQDWKKYEQQETPAPDNSFGKGLFMSLSIFSNALSLILKFILSLVLQLIYFAAALCIDAMRTFNLLILSLLGPFVLCISIFDGFQHLITDWLARYINIYLWLPITNLFSAMIGKIQAGMLRQDIANGTLSFSQTDAAYIIFLFIAIIGYFSIPSIANYVIQTSGGNNVLSKTNKMVMTAGRMMAGR